MVCLDKAIIYPQANLNKFLYIARSSGCLLYAIFYAQVVLIIDKNIRIINVTGN